MSKILVFNGSPHKKRTTAALLDAVAEGAKSKGAEIVLYDLNAKYIRGCQDCGACRMAGRELVCIQDDYLKPMYKDMLEAKGVVIGTPIYGGNITAQTLTLLQRLRPFRDAERKSLIPGKTFVTVFTQGNEERETYTRRIGEFNDSLKSYGWEHVSSVIWAGAKLDNGALPEEQRRESYSAGERLL